MADDLDSIAAILNKAENTDNEHEREMFMEAAQRKAARAGLELDMLRKRSQDKAKEQGKPVTRTIDVGEKGQRLRPRLAELLWRLAKENDQRIWAANNGHFVKLTGYKEDIDYTVMLWRSLMVQMVQGALDYLDTGEYKKERGVTRHDAMDSYYASFIQRVVERFRRLKNEELDKLEQEYQDQGDTTAVVLRDKRKEVSDAYFAEHGRVGSLQQPGTGTWSRSAGSRGRQDGNSANLRGQQGIGQGKGKLQ